MLGRYPIWIDGVLRAVTPHDLRRSYARNLFKAGISTEVIRQNLGHVDVKTTQAYIGVLDGSARAPVSVLRTGRNSHQDAGRHVLVARIAISLIPLNLFFRG